MWPGSKNRTFGDLGGRFYGANAPTDSVTSPKAKCKMYEITLRDSNEFLESYTHNFISPHMW